VNCEVESGKGWLEGNPGSNFSLYEPSAKRPQGGVDLDRTQSVVDPFGGVETRN